MNWRLVQILLGVLSTVLCLGIWGYLFARNLFGDASLESILLPGVVVHLALCSITALLIHRHTAGRVDTVDLMILLFVVPGVVLIVGVGLLMVPFL